jgi:hypothetical protein
MMQQMQHGVNNMYQQQMGGSPAKKRQRGQ